MKVSYASGTCGLNAQEPGYLGSFGGGPRSVSGCKRGITSIRSITGAPTHAHTL